MRWYVLCFVLLACSPTKKNSDESNEVATVGEDKEAPAFPPEYSVSEQNFKEGMQLLCDSITKVDATLDPSEMQRAVALWIDENVKNPDVRELFSIMGNVPPNKRAGMMKAAATKAGVTNCAIAEQ